MRRNPLRTVTVVVAGLVVALALAFFVSPHASSSPDGLEKVAVEKSLDTETRAHALAQGPLADYATRGVEHPSLSTGLAGIIGVAATFVLATGGAAAVRRIGASRRRAGAAASPSHT